MGLYPSGNSNENDEISINYDIHMDDSSTSCTASDDNNIPKSDINQIGHSGFYETQPKWMSNVNWCWYKAERDVKLGDKSAKRLDNARDIVLEQSYQIKSVMKAVQSIRNEYKDIVSKFSISDKKYAKM